MFKKYIKVKSICDIDGTLIPLAIIWQEESEYEIDRILEIRNAASPLGGCGILYRCLIQGNERHLFYEVNRWFIESTQP